MTTEEIRALQSDGRTTAYSKEFWLSEIAAQLAEYNERQARAEKMAMKIGEKSLAMMERSEKSLDELEAKNGKR